MEDSSKGIFFAVITALLWGFLAIALKVALQVLPPATIVWFRFFVAFVLLLIYFLSIKPSVISIFRKPPLKLIFAAVFLGLNYLGFITGVHFTSPSNAQVFIQIGPVLFALSGIFIFHEKLTWQNFVGFLLLIAGLILFYSIQTDVDFSGTANFNKGVLWVIGGALAWALFAFLQKQLVVNYSTGQLNLFIYGLCSVLALPFVEFGELTNLTTGMWILLVFLGVNTLLAYGSLSLAIKYAEANKVSAIITLNPLITFLTMAILANMNVLWIERENFTMMSFMAALVVLSGATLVVFFRKKSGNMKN